jgi:hypothetical protein
MASLMINNISIFYWSMQHKDLFSPSLKAKLGYNNMKYSQLPEVFVMD